MWSNFSFCLCFFHSSYILLYLSLFSPIFFLSLYIFLFMDLCLSRYLYISLSPLFLYYFSPCYFCRTFYKDRRTDKWFIETNLHFISLLREAAKKFFFLSGPATKKRGGGGGPGGKSLTTGKKLHFLKHEKKNPKKMWPLSLRLSSRAI